jgi:hypothetical protein
LRRVAAGGGDFIGAAASQPQQLQSTEIIHQEGLIGAEQQEVAAHQVT